MHIIYFLSFLLLFPSLSHSYINETYISSHNECSINLSMLDILDTRFVIDLSKSYSNIPFSYLSRPSKIKCQHFPIKLYITPFTSISNPSLLTTKLSLFKSKQTLNEFYFLTTDLLHSSKFIGFGYKISHRNLSFIHSLYDNNLISELSFTFGNEAYETNKYPLYFGKLPSNITHNYNNITIKVNESHNEWGINLNWIGFENTPSSYGFNIVNEYAYINTINDRIFVPMPFMDHLKRTVFTKYIKDNKCKVQSHNKTKYINCKCYNGIEDMKGFPNMKIKIDNSILTLHVEHLFKYVESEHVCLFIMQFNYKEPNVWFFGYLFIQEYITQFHVDRKEITFYSKRLVDDKYMYVYWNKIICVLVSILLSISIGIMLYSKRMN